MEQRLDNVLYAAVNEYIKTGRPVSSSRLCERYGFGVRPATIRTALNRLTDAGYLCQPHTSSGRVPGDMAYEFFAQRVGEEYLTNQKRETLAELELFQRFLTEEKQLFIRELAEELHLFGICYDTNSRKAHKSGLDELIEHLDTDAKSDLLEVIEDIERLEERMGTFAAAWEEQEMPCVYISKKSPITQSEHLSLISDAYTINGERFLLIAVGPKRMNYKKNLKLFTFFRNKMKSK